MKTQLIRVQRIDGTIDYLNQLKGDDIPENEIHFYRIGGGFVQVLNKSSVTSIENIKKIPYKSFDYRYAWVGLDGTESMKQLFKAYLLKGDYWNGWCDPLIPESEIEKFIKWFNEDLQDTPESKFSKLTLSEDRTEITHHDLINDEMYIGCSLVDVDHLGIKGFWVGMGLCWQEWLHKEICELKDFDHDIHTIEPTDALLDQIAIDFASNLRYELSGTEFLKIVKSNRWERDPAICHSHDVCDANEYMDMAINENLSRIYDISDWEHVNICNKAWTIAQERYFPTMTQILDQNKNGITCFTHWFNRFRKDQFFKSWYADNKFENVISYRYFMKEFYEQSK